MEFSAQMIAGLIGGTIEGNPDAKVNNFAKIEEGKPGCISFLANDKYEHYIYETQSSVVLVNNNFEPKKEVSATLIRVPDAREAVAKLLQAYESMKPKRTGISDMAFIDSTAKVGKDCYIGPFVSIAEGVEIGEGCVLHPHVCLGKNVKVGDNTEIYSNAVVYHDCKIGSRCILHAGCVIGADGFGFQPTETGYDKIPQIGVAIIEDDVEIGANTCVDRAVMGATVVHSGVKLDNLVQIAHNDEIGSHTVMSAQVGIAGSTKVASGVCSEARWVSPVMPLLPTAQWLVHSRASPIPSRRKELPSRVHPPSRAATSGSQAPSSSICPTCGATSIA